MTSQPTATPKILAIFSIALCTISALFWLLIHPSDSETKETPTTQNPATNNGHVTHTPHRPWTHRSKHEQPPLPGITTPSLELTKTLNSCAKGNIVRTEHLHPNGAPKFTNRLACETSPYLLQHAHNPVNWYPWSKEAFEEAARRDVPVLLSVGYATCHWCHVMERESFEDINIATFINTHFIAVKVDREERPDVDDVYMNAVHILNGRGGWPMTVVMTPDRKPFFAGTYFPPKDRGRRRGFLSILTDLHTEYTTKRKDIVTRAHDLSKKLSAQPARSPKHAPPNISALDRSTQQLAQRFDPIHGGFSRAPKFPRPANLHLLLHAHRRFDDPAILQMITTTLDAMKNGGVYDHVGGGFHRYSTDTRWLVPHFEKMLYDNAQLVHVYLSAWQITQDPAYARVVHETLEAIHRDMTRPSGAFYSATDADSFNDRGEREEGWFFTWKLDTFRGALPPDDADLLAAWWALSKRGNFEGRNILHTPHDATSFAQRHNTTPKTLQETIDRARPLLLKKRDELPPPLLDDKVITSWNGLMISAFARAGKLLNEARYIQHAQRAAEDLLSLVLDENKRLRRTFRKGRTQGDGILDDYAFTIQGLLDLFIADPNPIWLQYAETLQATQDAHFLHENKAGYYLTADDAETLLVRPFPDYDGAEPSGNSISAVNLMRLYALTLDPTYLSRATSLLRGFHTRLARSGTSVPRMLSALDMYEDTALQVVLVRPEGSAPGALSAALRTQHAPTATILSLDASKLRTYPVWLHSKVPKKNKETAYLCQEGTCQRPTTDPTTLLKQLEETRTLSSHTHTPIALPNPKTTPRPWFYDAKTDQHWHPEHNHWHRGKPPTRK